MESSEFAIALSELLDDEMADKYEWVVSPSDLFALLDGRRGGNYYGEFDWPASPKTLGRFVSEAVALLASTYGMDRTNEQRPRYRFTKRRLAA